MSGMTLRQHLEAILAEPVLYYDADYGTAIRHAEAALAILGSAERLGRISQRIWPEDDRVAVLDPKGSA